MDEKGRERYRSRRIRQIREEGGLSGRKGETKEKREFRGNRDFPRGRTPGGERISREERMQRRKRRRRKKLLLSGLIYALLAVLILLIVLLVFMLVSFLKNDEEKNGFGGFSLPWTDTEKKTVIMLDAGHGGKDQGTSYGDILEKDLTLEITKKVEKELKSAGYEVELTRSKDESVNIYERVRYANQEKPDLFVSIHCNFLERGEVSGIETYYAEEKGDASRELAEKLQICMVAKTGAYDRNVRTEDFLVIKDTKMPAALIETGFLSDPGERELLQDEEYQKKLAEGISEGIIGYWEARKEAQEQKEQEEPDSAAGQ